MKIRDHIEIARRANESAEVHPTIENPYQPPWIRDLQEMIGLIVFGVWLSSFTICSRM
jgi:hypothetical protein